MCDNDIQTDFDIKGLSLIDVSSEDDCLLIDSPVCNQISLPFSGSFNEHGKLEEDESRGNGRCNLRKSLTWDSSFFNSAAFLEPEEGEMHTSPVIQEDVDKSCDASTTLDSRATRRKSLEDDSVEPASNDVEKEAETTDSRIVSNKVLQKGGRKKLNTAVKDLGKIIKQVSSRPQTSQSANPPKGVSRAGSISITQTKRASVGCKAAKYVTRKGTTMSKTRAFADSGTTMSRSTSSRSSSNMISNDSKIAAEGRSPPGRSLLSTLAKLNSSMSAASSYSDSSSESSSSSSSTTSIASRRSNSVRANLGSAYRMGLVTESDAQQVLDSQDDALAVSENNVSNASAGRLNPISLTPSGLRPPSSKLAFSNWARLSRHTRNRSMPSCPSGPIGLPNFGAKSSDPSCSLNKAPLRNGPRNPKISSGITPKLQNENSLRIDKVTQRLRALVLHRKK